MVATVNAPVRETATDTPSSTVWLGATTIASGTTIVPSQEVGVLELAHPVIVQVRVTRHGWVVSSGELDEESFGETFHDAYLDFLTSLRDRYVSLRRHEERLSPEDRIVLERLTALLRPQSS